VALLNFFRTARGQEEGQPVVHNINNNALLAKLDWNLNAKNNLSVSYNFDYSKNPNQTFDVATYGNSANGIEGGSKIQVLNLNPGTVLAGYLLHRLGVDNEFKISVFMGNDNPFSVLRHIVA
jgi:hypothetical protein